MLSQDEIKKLVAIEASKLVENNMVIGLGTGSTALHLIVELGRRVKEGLSIKAVPTSKKTAALAAEHGIPVVGLNDVQGIDLTMDGADEVDDQLNLIKGGGGALLQEKMVAFASTEMVVIVDHTKHVKKLGKFPLPLDVIPFGWKRVQEGVQNTYNIEVSLRQTDGQPFVTDHEHYILDCHFQLIESPDMLEFDLDILPGVAECGLFIGLASKALIGLPDGSIKVIS